MGAADSAALAQAHVSVSRVRPSLVARTVAGAASACRMSAFFVLQGRISFSACPPPLQREHWNGQPTYLGDLFRVSKMRGDKRLSAVCKLWTHHLGWEVRLEINGDLQRSEVFRSQDLAGRRVDGRRDLERGLGPRRAGREADYQRFVTS